MTKNLFVLSVGNYRPDLTIFTLPTLRAYAEKIGAEFHLITERQFHEWPVSYEKLQVHRLGLGAAWNVLIDADTMLHPDTPDVTAGDPGIVRFAFGHSIKAMFCSNAYFERCGHDQAIAANFVATSHLTHCLWKPLPLTFETARKETKRLFTLDEYALTVNLAKYGLRFSGIMAPSLIDHFLIHLGSAERSDAERASDALRAERLSRAWGFT